MTKLINITYTHKQFKYAYGHLNLKLKCMYNKHIKYVRCFDNKQITVLYKDLDNYQNIMNLAYMIENNPTCEIYMEEI